MRRGSWARYAAERLRLLARWRELAGIVAKACREVFGERCRAVYVAGGAAEDRLTVLSDIDVLWSLMGPGWTGSTRYSSLGGERKSWERQRRHP